MLMSKLETGVALVLMVSVIGTGAALINYRAWADEKSAKNAPPKPAEAQDGEKLKALLKERRAFAKGEFDSWKRDAVSYVNYLTDLDQEAALRRGPQPRGDSAALEHLRVFNAQLHLYQWSQRLLTAELELSDKKADRVAAYEVHLLRMKELEDVFKKAAERAKAGAYAAAYAEAKFHRLEAEIMLERAKGK
jgi:hypothetical protein